MTNDVRQVVEVTPETIADTLTRRFATGTPGEGLVLSCHEAHMLVSHLAALQTELQETEAARGDAVDGLAACYRATGSIQTEGCSNEETAGLAIDAVEMLRERAEKAEADVSALTRKVEDLAQDRVVADAEAARLREELTYAQSQMAR